MDAFGFFRDIEASLPEEFTAVFEIARVLEDPDSRLARTLRPVMNVAQRAPEKEPAKSRQRLPNRFVSHGEEYEAALMQSVSDIKRIFPHQLLLPEDVFMRRLAQRSLWINVPRTPRIIPFRSSDSEYDPNNFKQKVYLLLDTSTSMAAHHRFQMAKAVCYVFLRQNLRELGHVYFRTFDVDLGPLQRATDMASLQRLIRHAMRLNRLGNGTMLERAILQAADDIRAQSALSGAEILVITDGAAHLDLDRLRQSLGATISVNCVKIGDASIVPDEKLLRDLASRGSGTANRQLAGAEEQLRRARHDLSMAASDHDRRVLQNRVAGLERQCDDLRARIVGPMREWYGREIELLATVFVAVNDVSTDEIFSLQQPEIDELKQLLLEIEEDFGDGIDADSLREAALLNEHVQMLLRYADNPEHVEQLREIAERLRQLLGEMISSPEGARSLTRGISRDDAHDLQMMLQVQAERNDSFLRLLRLIFGRIVRRLLRR